MEKRFHLRERGTTVRTEIVAGVTTFLTMAYIIIVNPAVLSAAGVPFDQVFFATVVAAVIGTLTIALFANYPIAIAPGMGLNAYFTSVVATQGISYQTVFAAVFVAGILFLLLTFSKFQEMLIAAIPAPLKFGITAGIGLFIAFLGLKMAGIVVANPDTLITLGNLQAPETVLSIIGLFITVFFIMRNIKGALFIGMAITALLGYMSGMLTINGVVSLPPMPVILDFDFSGLISHSLYSVVFAFLLVTLFDTTGTFIGVTEQAGLAKDGKLTKTRAVLTADALATTIGAAFGTSPSTTYIESSSGIAAGGRTGLTSVVVALLFAASLFLSPLIASISSLSAITAPALIIVGSYMMGGLAKVEWGKFDEAFPAFIVIVSMPLTSSIATGIALGFILYPLLKLFSGRGKEVHPIVYIIGVIFVLQMIFFPMH